MKIKYTVKAIHIDIGGYAKVTRLHEQGDQGWLRVKSQFSVGEVFKVEDIADSMHTEVKKWVSKQGTALSGKAISINSLTPATAEEFKNYLNENQIHY